MTVAMRTADAAMLLAASWMLLMLATWSMAMTARERLHSAQALCGAFEHVLVARLWLTRSEER